MTCKVSTKQTRHHFITIQLAKISGPQLDKITIPPCMCCNETAGSVWWLLYSTKVSGVISYTMSLHNYIWLGPTVYLMLCVHCAGKSIMLPTLYLNNYILIYHFLYVDNI